MQRVLFFLILLSFCSPTKFVFSQLKDYKFQYLSNNEGLSQSSVITIFQDSKGFMWFGTRDGLNRYDGYKFIIYKHDPNNPYSISNNFIKKIIEDSEGNIWVATEGGGLNKFDRKKERFLRFEKEEGNPNTLSTNFINDVIVDQNGYIWAATNDNFLNKLDVKSNKVSRYKIDPPNNTTIEGTHTVFEDKGGNLWVGTIGGGLYLFDRKQNKTIKAFTHNPRDPNSLGDNTIWVIFEDSKNNLWIGTYGGGLNLYDKERDNFRIYKENGNTLSSLSQDYIMAVAEDNSGKIWIGTENKGINILDPATGEVSSITHDDSDNSSLSSNSIYSIFNDKKGNIWLGTFNGGVNFLDSDASKFLHHKHKPLDKKSLSNNRVTSIFEDIDKNIWVATDGGGVELFDRNSNNFTHFRHKPNSQNSICGDFVLSVHGDSDGNLWIGTYGDGLTIYNKKKNSYRHFKSDDSNGLRSNNVWCIYEDSKKNIWVGTYGGGLHRYDKSSNKFIAYKSQNVNINTLYEDSKGNLYAGMKVGGLSILDESKMELVEYKTSNGSSLNIKTVNCVYEDKKGNLWIGTREDLNMVDIKRTSIASFTTKNGLPNDAILGLLQDKSGNLWISTNKGISRFSPDAKTFKNYTTAEGLQAYEFKEGSYCLTSDGEMYFGGINGFNRFFPDNIKERNFDPPIVFTDFEIFNKPVEISDANDINVLKQHISETEEVTLSYKSSVISFEFASLNYTSSEKKKYSYKLEGFDKDWRYIGTKHSITYTNLDPGKYTLLVKGLNNKGEWSSQVADLNITISPPFWKTLYFRVLIVTMVLFTIFFIYHLRTRTIQRQKKKLESEVKIRTSELREANLELQKQKEEIFEQKEQILTQRDQINTLYSDVRDSIKAAEALQKAIMPNEQRIRAQFSECFILNKPKDVVSGDFYWFNVKGDQTVVAVIDCTGHGVSGAFMSINGHHLMNQVINSLTDLQAADILDKLNESLFEILHRNEENSKTLDGMDIAICVFDKDKKNVQFAGAVLPLYIIRSTSLLQIKGDRIPLGLPIKGKLKKYNNNQIELQSGDVLYMFTDGYADQIGGEGGDEKLMYIKFRQLLLTIGHQELTQQAILLEENLNDWKGANQQLDDILILGLKV